MKKLKNRGFSIVDLLVSMSIVTLIMSVVLFSYRTFGNKLAVSAASQEIAVAVHKAQVYGVSVKEVSKGGGDFNTGYGVAFDTENPSQYYIFADKNHNGLYDGDSTCALGSECIEKNLIRNSAAITRLCGIDAGGVQTCPPNGATGLSVVFPPSQFQAGNEDASIVFSGISGALPGSYASAVVVTTLGDAIIQTTVQSSVTISQTGQTYVQDLPSIPTSNHPPVINLVGATPMTVMTGSTFTDPGAIATDDEDGNITARIIKTGSVNTLIPATYTLTYNVKDSQNFPATAVTRSVTVTSSCSLALSSSANTDTSPSGVAIKNTYAYVVSMANSTLQVFDISNPASPVSVASVGTESRPVSVAISGNYAYVANIAASTLQVFDISNPISPVSVSSTALSFRAFPYHIAISGNYAYIVNYGGNTLQVFDISNPISPISVGSVATSDYPHRVAIFSGYAYVANGVNNTLQIFNVSNPASPTAAGSINIGGLVAADVSILGNYMYVLNGSSTFQVYSLSNPASPNLVGTVGTFNSPSALTVSGNYAYVTNTNSTLQVFDISDPTNPRAVATAATNAPAVDIVVSGNYTYVVNETSSTLQSFNFQCF